MKPSRLVSSSGKLCLVLMVWLLPDPAHAGSFPFWGVSFGTSEKASAQVGLAFGRSMPSSDSEGLSIGTGPVIEATVGSGAGKFGVGRSILVITEDSIRVFADLKATATRTWDRPRGASPHATYLGVEGGLSVAFVRLHLGVSKRVEDKTRGANVLFTWGAGVQIRAGGKRKQR